MRVSPSTGALMPTRGFSRRVDRRVPLEMWVSADGLLVISQLDMMYLPGTGDTEVGPTWLVSVSRDGGRASDADVIRVVEAFAMPAWDEDNHTPGISRALFCPVEERYRTACECKVSETLIVEPDGYQWTNPVDGPCRGCELERATAALGRRTRCPIHQPAQVTS